MGRSRSLLLLWAALAAFAGPPPVQPPPFLDGLFPCTGCHDGVRVVTNPRRRVLEDMHENIVLNHLGGTRWCFDCHDPRERDRLHLKTGEPIDFTASWRLCAQCHAAKVQAWQAREHGAPRKPAGPGGPLPLCVSCHNPHAPR